MSFIGRILRGAAPQRKAGETAEILAASFLARQGLAILARNYRVRGGEIDLIAADGATLVFVEVRLRRHPGYGGAGASITPTKQRRLLMAARHYLLEHGEQDCRFDCLLMDALTESRIEWVRNAFSAD